MTRNRILLMSLALALVAALGLVLWPWSAPRDGGAALGPRAGQSARVTPPTSAPAELSLYTPDSA